MGATERDELDPAAGKLGETSHHPARWSSGKRGRWRTTWLLSRYGITYTSVFDPTGRIAGEFGAVGLPTTFIIDRHGLIRYEVIGRIDPDSISRALDTLAGATP